MDAIHLITARTDAFRGRSAVVKIPVWGRWSQFGISVFSKHFTHYDSIDWWLTRITYALSPANDGNYDPRLATIDGRVLIPVDGRRIEQKSEFPPLYGNFLNFSCLAHTGEEAGRFVSMAILRRTESLAEKLKTHAFHNFSSVVRSGVDKMYGDITVKAFSEVLSKFNWKFLLEDTGCEDRTSSVVDYSLRNNTPTILRYNRTADIAGWTQWGDTFENHELDRRIQAIQELQAQRDRERRAEEQARYLKSNETAASMLADVLGDKAYKQLLNDGHITIEKNGYGFQLTPQRWITVTDPNGKTAELCIHTAAYSCHPIDEVVLAALNIEHYFDEFMKTSIFHCVQPGFVKPKLA